MLYSNVHTYVYKKAHNCKIKLGTYNLIYILFTSSNLKFKIIEKLNSVINICDDTGRDTGVKSFYFVCSIPRY